MQINDTVRRWYALYTKSRAEKKVAGLLQEDSIEVYLPLQKTIRQWSDRKKTVYVPLFRSYLFVHVNCLEFDKVYKTPGAVGFVTFANEKVPVPDFQIEAVRTFLGEMPIVEPIEYFEVGNEVEVAYGSLRGLRGKLKNTRDYRKLIVQIEALNQNITLTIPSHLINKIK